jgi:hypothetical protein
MYESVWVRTAVAVIAAGVLALLAAACSGGKPSPARSGGRPKVGGSATSPSAVAYSGCMRSHGVPKFPDPDPDPGGGRLPKTDARQLGVSTSQLQAAQRSCQPLLPTGGSSDQQAEQCFNAGNCPQALVEQIMTAQRKYAQCMRSHGLPKFPDPSLDSQGRPVFVISISKNGFDPHSAQYMAKEDLCQRRAPAPEARQVSP